MSVGAGLVQTVTLAIVLVLAVTLFVLVRRPRRPPRRAVPVLAGRDGRPPRASVIVHGVKVDDQDARRRQIETVGARLGWAAPVWLETTAEDPGRAQARAALDSGTDAVLAFGGDGTARVVAEVLAHSGTPMGLLPAGTGNLLARNLGIPPNRLEASLDIALTGRERTIDVGRVSIGSGAAQVSEAFLVMAGLGFDAEIMAGVDPQLKERLGWGAYVVSGMRSLRGKQTPVTIRVDDDEPVQHRVRAVVVGNCGMLQGGIQLMPGALPDDGWLDVIIISPRSLLGWLSVGGAVITRRRAGATVEHLRCRTIEVRAERPMAAQLDGDPAGFTDALTAAVDPLALKIRVPG